MILITGATGHLGSLVLKYVQQYAPATPLAILARDKSKTKEFENSDIDIRLGDYDDYNSLVQAFTGIDKLYFVSGSDIAKRIKQHENIVIAAKEAGVNHIIYTSFIRERGLENSPIPLVAEGHLKTEDLIKKSGLNYTILKHNIYMEVIPMFIGEHILENKTIYLPAGEGKCAFVSREDMAKAGAIVLTTKDHANKEYNITAEEAYSYKDIAEMISEVTGKDILYVSPSQKEFTATLKENGVPDDIIRMMAGFSEATKIGEFKQTSHDVTNLIGEKPTKLKEYLRSVYAN
tara:strand:+ start:586 stop:1455 length:870 start_codon:yes stop_codon:yes gene_type:complete